MEFAETKLTTMFNFFINNSTECILFYGFEEKSSIFGKTNLVPQSEFSHELKKIGQWLCFFSTLSDYQKQKVVTKRSIMLKPLQLQFEGTASVPACRIV